MHGIGRILISILLVFPLGNLNAQEKGCTDPRAQNFSILAGINDGNCNYPNTLVRPRMLLDHLPDALTENSGLISFMGFVWFINDSGNENKLYAYDTFSRHLVKEYVISATPNIDWEDICQDSQFIYIGDIGNNSGKRERLQVYKISKENLLNDTINTLRAELIEFSYPDFHSPAGMPNKHNFDCEAMLVMDDSLYLFSKNWQNQWTKLYSLPIIPGQYEATLLDSFFADGLVTAADIDDAEKIVFLLGYKNYIPFIWILFDFKEHDFFSGNKRRIDFPFSYLGSQAEGICALETGSVLISTEHSRLKRNQLMVLETEKWTRELSIDSIQAATSYGIDFNERTHILGIELNNECNSLEVEIFSSQGQVIRSYHFSDVMKGSFFSFDLGNLEAGNYLLRLQSGVHEYSAWFQKN